MPLQTLAIIVAAKYLIILPVLIALLLIVRLPKEQRKTFAITAIISLILIFLASRIASWFYYDPRPFVTENFIPLIPHAADNGFPSDHTLLASAIAAIITSKNRRLGIALWALAILIGASRVLAGVHSPIDIVGSIVIAFAVNAGVVAGFQAKNTYTKSQIH